MSSTAPAGTQAVDRAAALVDLVVRADEPLSFTELSDETGLARSTTSRLLAALERTELVERDAAGGYVAGPLFALHAALHDPWPQIARLARPVLETVGEQTGETVHLGVRRGDGRRAHRPGRVDASCCRRATGTRSTYPRTARRSARCSTPTACSPVPTGRLERRTDRTITTREALRRRAARRSASTRLRDHRGRARDRAHRYRRPRRGHATACSPRSASPGPPPGSRTGSTASVGSSSSRPTRCRPCSGAGPGTAPTAPTKEGAA